MTTLALTAEEITLANSALAVVTLAILTWERVARVKRQRRVDKSERVKAEKIEEIHDQITRQDKRP